jgi:uncharacterized repeat protein (TIGR01451 family)
MKKARFALSLVTILLAVLVTAGAWHGAAYNSSPSSTTSTPNESILSETLVRRSRDQATGTTTFHTTTISIDTYPYQAYLHTGFDSTHNFPYHWLDRQGYENSGPSPTPQDYTLLVLENDYLVATLMPELGGRIYQLIYKATGSNELYQNTVIKPTHWGPLAWEENWWLAAGGIEWCLPVEEHGYVSGEPWSWRVVTSTSGVTVTIWDSEAGDRLTASIDVSLPSDRGMLVITPQLENPTADELNFKFWLNAALAPGPGNQPTAGLEFIFNSDLMSVHSTSDPVFPCDWPDDPDGPDCLFSWPVHAARDFSLLGNWDGWLGFFEYPDAAADFVGVYSVDADEGVARVFPSHIARGAKGFAPGWAHPIDWHLWTDDGSGGVELHGGVAPTFWDTAVLSASSTLSWTEYWYPVGDIGTISVATEDAALGLRRVSNRLEVGAHPTQAWPMGETSLHVWERNTCAELATWSMPMVSPNTPFMASIPAGSLTPDDITVAYAATNGQLLATINTTDCLPPQAWVEDLPRIVETTLFSVTWSGEDPLGTISTFDVQFRDGFEGQWTDWLTFTSALSATFSGSHRHTYSFRARGRDIAGNRGEYTNEVWGQAFTTVLTETAPVLVTSRKTTNVLPAAGTGLPNRFLPGQLIPYSLVISNTGNLTATAILTDIHPAELTLLTGTLSSTWGSLPSYAGGEVQWNGQVPPSHTVQISYVLSPTTLTPTGVPLTNTLWLSGSVLGPVVRQEVVIQVHGIWLPVTARGWRP